ncbi:hypothetical protein [Chitinophaga vietnamensis]|uniref:hypothetical protein n=1 Tax=Chitinophaga vietnamensis TaxID=2593957 RepID=UPI0011775988|nr:hypothetical protein [Chitinophaga vietnamensis]
MKPRSCIYLILLLLTSACVTSKSDYFFAQSRKLSDKYGWRHLSDHIDTAYHGPEASWKELKHFLDTMEYQMALFPDTARSASKSYLSGDSIVMFYYRLDSIYTNANKIKYIREHHLQTPNKILISPSWKKKDRDRKDHLPVLSTISRQKG